MDNWDRRMETLAGYQEDMEDTAKIVEEWLIAYQQGRVASLANIPADTRNLFGVLTKGLRQQVAFNNTVIQMLTDLDYRKCESE